MNHVCRLSFACLIATLAGCEVSSDPLNWPSFDDKVIDVGRRVLKTQADERRGSFAPTPAEPGVEDTKQDEPIPATRDAVLENLKVWVGVRGVKGHRAVEAIRQLGPDAVGPLLEILADDSLPRRYTERTVSLLIPLGFDWNNDPDDPHALSLTPPADRIFDHIVDYVQRHPDARPNLGNLYKLTSLDRIPKLIELIETSSGDRQKMYIGLFSALTYEHFPTIPRGFCGNSSPASIRQAIEAGEVRQRESVAAIKAWWAEHKNESPDVWLATSLRRSIHASIEYLEDQVITEGDDKQQRWQKNHAIRDYNSFRFGVWRSSVFDMLVEEFEKAPGYVKPYVLRMIGSTKHPDAAAFIAPNLKNSDPNLQYAAIAALKDMQVADHRETIGRILRSTKDIFVALEAIDALKGLAKSEAIEDFTYALDHPEQLVLDRAKDALRPYLISHADRLRKIAREHPSQEVRKTLGVMLDGAAAANAISNSVSPTTSPEERIAAIRALLRSDDPERQKSGISLARDKPELLPDVLELIQSIDYYVRKAAVELVQKMGIPGLTIENAPRLMGYSVELDRHIAAYCYAKYGRKAASLMMRAAFNLDDPLKLGSKYIPFPAVGLIRAILQEKIPGIEEAVIRVVEDGRTRSRYVGLLELLDDPKSASLVGEYLHHEERHYRGAAIRVIVARHLTQHTDRLFELASLTKEL